MNALVPQRNRYLTTASGRSLVPRIVPALASFGPILVVPLFGGILFTIAAAMDLGVLAAIVLALSSLSFVIGAGMAWYFILGGMSRNTRAAQALMVGDINTAVPLAQWPLPRAFRADVRMRSFYILGLAAEQNSDFAEAEECFRAAYGSIPAFGNSRLKRHGQLLMLCHSALALVATGRFAEADNAVRMASALFVPVPGGGGFMDAFTNDAAFGAMGVSGALQNLEPGRDPRALLSLVSALVLVSKGMPREGLELVERERYFLNAGLLPREKALVANIENRARAAFAGGPMRSPGQMVAPADPMSGWAARILPPG